MIYHNKSQCVWDTYEAYYIPINTITGIYYGRYSFPSDIKTKEIHDLLFDEDQCTCGDKKGDHKMCLKYIGFHVLAIKYDDTYVIHPCEHDRVIAFIEGKPPPRQRKVVPRNIKCQNKKEWVGGEPVRAIRFPHRLSPPTIS